MKSYAELMNHPLLWILVEVGLATICLFCGMFYKKTKARALELGISNDTLKAINKSTLALTIVPSLSIVIGLIVLSQAIGTPWAQFRLSVVGAVTYELIAAQMATAALGFAEMTQAAASDGATFGAVMFVMSIGIIAGIVTMTIFGKSIINGTAKIGKAGGFGNIANGCFMLAMMCVFLPIQATTNMINIFVMATAMLVAFLIGVIQKKTGAKWLGDFSMAFILIIGMASSLLWTSLFAK